jgi:hypothetical protein
MSNFEFPDFLATMGLSEMEPEAHTCFPSAAVCYYPKLSCRPRLPMMRVQTVDQALVSYRNRLQVSDPGRSKLRPASIVPSVINRDCTLRRLNLPGRVFATFSRTQTYGTGMRRTVCAIDYAREAQLFCFGQGTLP